LLETREPIYMQLALLPQVPPPGDLWPRFYTIRILANAVPNAKEIQVFGATFYLYNILR
jgi:hypothetical protein